MSRLPPLSEEEKARLAEVCLSAIEMVLATGELPLFVQFLTSRGNTRGQASLSLDREAKPPSGQVARHASTAHAEEAVQPSRVVAETTATEDAILDVLAKAEKPLKRETIAKRASCTDNSHFAYALRRLVNDEPKRVARLSGHVYWLISRGNPSQTN